MHNELLHALLWIDSFAGERIEKVHLFDEGCVQLAKAEEGKHENSYQCKRVYSAQKTCLNGSGEGQHTLFKISRKPILLDGLRRLLVKEERNSST